MMSIYQFLVKSYDKIVNSGTEVLNLTINILCKYNLPHFSPVVFYHILFSWYS